MAAALMRSSPHALGTNLTALNSVNAVSIAFWMRRLVQGNGTMDVFQHRNSVTAARDGFAITCSATELQMRVYGSAGSNTSFVNQQQSRHQSNEWKHYCITFDDALNDALFYVNGVWRGRSANTRDMTSIGTTRTTIGGDGVNGMTPYALFDVQLFVEKALSPSEARMTMDPKKSVAGITARWYGRKYNRQLVAGNTLEDETGNGHNLSVQATTDPLPEPPYLPTFQ